MKKCKTLIMEVFFFFQIYIIIINYKIIKIFLLKYNSKRNKIFGIFQITSICFK